MTGAVRGWKRRIVVATCVASALHFANAAYERNPGRDASIAEGVPAWDKIVSSGFEDPCSEDADGDRLVNCVETASGHFVGALNTGTNPTRPDSDDDGLSDGDEVLGTVAGLDLSALGTSPVHKDILIEYDWFDDSIGCGPHSHRPTAQSTAIVRSVFADAPIANPDGTSGINIIQDFGQGGLLTGGNLIDDPDGEIDDGLGVQFDTYKAAHFSVIRRGYFHYVLLPHHVSDAGHSFTGIAEINGNDLIVALFCYYKVDSTVAATILHETGHNLGLRHGGDEDCNYKPNYNSVMNYLYNGNGDGDCDASGDGVVDYSHGVNRNLDENHLDESLGVCVTPVVPIDWNSNGVIESFVSQDLNFVDHDQASSCGGISTVLHDYDDWAHLSLFGVAAPDSLARSSQTIAECDPPIGGLP